MVASDPSELRKGLKPSPIGFSRLSEQTGQGTHPGQGYKGDEGIGTPPPIVNITNTTIHCNLYTTASEPSDPFGTMNPKSIVGPSIFTREKTISIELERTVDKLYECHDDPLDFEQCRAILLNTLSGLHERKHSRERYFSDLLMMTEIASGNIEHSIFTEDVVRVLKDAIDRLNQVIIDKDIIAFRQKFREVGLDIRPRVSSDPDTTIRSFFREDPT